MKEFKEYKVSVTVADDDNAFEQFTYCFVEAESLEDAVEYIKKELFIS